MRVYCQIGYQLSEIGANWFLGTILDDTGVAVMIRRSQHMGSTANTDTGGDLYDGTRITKTCEYMVPAAHAFDNVAGYHL